MNLDNLPIENVSSKSNYRLKICVNFLNKTSYNDVITDKFLLEKINKFMQKVKNGNIIHGFFQKSNYNNHYSIIIYCSEQLEFENIYCEALDDDLKVFGYCIITDEHKKINYVSEDIRLDYKYYDFIWTTSVNSFIQVNPGAGTFIHNTVKNLICDKYYFFGIGGEMGIYVKELKKTKFTCLTNSRNIHDDCVLNYGLAGFHLVDYENVRLKNFKSRKNMVLVVNISRSGLKNLATQIIKMPFKQIIYIGCSDKTIQKDMKILTKVYAIDKIIKIDQFPQTKQVKKQHYSYIVNLLRHKN